MSEWQRCTPEFRAEALYRWLQKTEPAAEEIAIRAAIQEIASEHRGHYGYRRITAELRYRGMVVNRKRVLRMMQEDNLLAIRRRKFISTMDSRHPFEVYVNLAGTNGTDWAEPVVGSRFDLYYDCGRNSYIWR